MAVHVPTCAPYNNSIAWTLSIIILIVCPVQFIILIRCNYQIVALHSNVTDLSNRLMVLQHSFHTVVNRSNRVRKSVGYEVHGLDANKSKHVSAEEAADQLLSPISDFVILPTYARVPTTTLQKFCQSTVQHCKNTGSATSKLLRGPPGPQGPRGFPGPPGINCDCTNNFSISLLEGGIQRNSSKMDHMQMNYTHTPLLQTTTPKRGDQYVHKKHKHRHTRTRPNPKRRIAKCYIHSLGKIVNYGERTSYFGAWMKDALNPASESYWVMEHIFGISVQMFKSREQLVDKLTKEMVDLEDMYEGTNHIVHNGSLFYHRMGKNSIVRYDLSSGKTRERELDDIISRGSEYLYQQQGEVKSYMDLATDEHGLWVIYRRKDRDYLSISRLAYDLSQEATWEVEDLGPSNISNAFIVCGVLYTVIVDSETNTAHVSQAYDLYTHQVSDVYPKLRWTGVHGNISMINYNPSDHNLYVYDQGYMYTVPVNIVNAHK